MKTTDFGKWLIMRSTAKDRFRRALKRISEWCRDHRHYEVARSVADSLAEATKSLCVLRHYRKLRSPRSLSLRGPTHVAAMVGYALATHG